MGLGLTFARHHRPHREGGPGHGKTQTMIQKRPLFPIAGLFIAVQSLLNLFGDRLVAAGMDKNVLMSGNLFVFLITLLSMWILMRGMRNAKTMAFMRSVYTSFISKFFLVAIAVLVYALWAKDRLNPAAVLGTMFLYLIYTFIEVRVLLKLMKQKPDVEERSAA
jgi:hypothetical protein